MTHRGDIDSEFKHRFAEFRVRFSNRMAIVKENLGLDVPSQTCQERHKIWTTFVNDFLNWLSVDQKKNPLNRWGNSLAKVAVSFVKMSIHEKKECDFCKANPNQLTDVDCIINYEKLTAKTLPGVMGSRKEYF